MKTALKYLGIFVGVVAIVGLICEALGTFVDEGTLTDFEVVAVEDTDIVLITLDGERQYAMTLRHSSAYDDEVAFIGERQYHFQIMADAVDSYIIGEHYYFYVFSEGEKNHYALSRHGIP